MSEANPIALMNQLKTGGYATPHLPRFIAYILIDWAIIIGAYWVAAHYLSVLSIAFALIVIGNRQHALSALVHEGAHYLATGNRPLTMR